jgi:Bacterial SH3 domain
VYVCRWDPDAEALTKLRSATPLSAPRREHAGALRLQCPAHQLKNDRIFTDNQERTGGPFRTGGWSGLHARPKRRAQLQQPLHPGPWVPSFRGSVFSLCGQRTPADEGVQVRSELLIAAVALVVACAPKKPADPAPAPVASRPAGSLAPRPDLDRRIAKLELGLWEREAQLQDLQTRLDDARAEVVRAMAKLQTLASRADAASGMAEAEVALQSLKSRAGQPAIQEATRLLQQSAAEFDKENYGGAIYLAAQAKTLSTASRTRFGAADRFIPRPGETAFALPIDLRAGSGGKVRQAPGTEAAVAFSVQPGQSLTGYSYVNDWIRVSDDDGRGGWILRSGLIRR